MEPVVLTVAVVAAVAAAVLGGAVQSALGFGASFAMVPVLAVVAPGALPGAALVALLPLVTLMAVRERRSMNRASVVRMVLARLPGTLVGTIAVVMLPTRGLAAVVAVLLILAVVASARGLTIAITPTSERLAGAASGFSGTTVGLGGPPLAILYRGRHSSEIRPTLAGVFSAGIVVSLASLTVAGQFQPDDASLGVLMAAGTVTGLFVASPLVRRIPEDWLRAGLLWWAGVGAVLALVRVLVG